MRVNDAPVQSDGKSGDEQLELLTDDEGVWTAVPVDASGEERVSKWLSIDGDSICDLEEWR
ncbi:hypothetical protein [Natrialba sp. INN-245]|uniref:DUF7511 domain-containing protein n=1 Tax=Natrialba sp. INN-245 TaxID=2690967 RepID=UPI001311D5F2|nr:hypothetical protein [Natrialba sp. INN-245]MWV38346.1 hypothetical protein [Natrialba sp. INN-245]